MTETLDRAADATVNPFTGKKFRYTFRVLMGGHIDNPIKAGLSRMTQAQVRQRAAELGIDRAESIAKDDLISLITAMPGNEDRVFDWKDNPIIHTDDDLAKLFNGRAPETKKFERLDHVEDAEDYREWQRDRAEFEAYKRSKAAADQAVQSRDEEINLDLLSVSDLKSLAADRGIVANTNKKDELIKLLQAKTKG